MKLALALSILGAVGIPELAVADRFDFYGCGADQRKAFSMVPLELVLKRAREGDYKAQNNLGCKYEWGYGVGEDYKEAARWYLASALQGFSEAQYNLGLMHLYADEEHAGVPQDYTEAVRWLTAAAVQDSSDAQFSLGLIYEQGGPGVPRDLEAAAKWFTAAALLGDHYALIRLDRLPKRAGIRENGPSAIIPITQRGGTFIVPVTINRAMTLNFTIDSGASDVTIPADVVSTLTRLGTINDKDFLGKQTYRLADGRNVPSETFRIRSLKIGDTVLENVTASITPIQGSLLLGQSFLSRFKSWSIDNQRQVLVLE